jgi:ribosomal protein L11 methyltransferase
VTADVELADAIGTFLIDHGAPGLLSEDVPTGARITAHFRGDFPDAPFAVFCRQLQEWFPGSSPPQVSIEATSEQDWADNWKAHFPPLDIGERLWVHPPWITEIPFGRVAVMIDPGMAFGTGHHASTRGCLTFLERCVAADRSMRVLDIGTGSGVLSIAAAKLGAGEVWAIDTDPDACTIATVNAHANGVGERVHVRPDLPGVTGAFDIVVANLFATQLIEMATLIHDRLVPSGTAIGAGILVTESESVVHAWRAAGLAVGLRIDEAEWTTITARRQ